MCLRCVRRASASIKESVPAKHLPHIARENVVEDMLEVSHAVWARAAGRLERLSRHVLHERVQSDKAWLTMPCPRPTARRTRRWWCSCTGSTGFSTGSTKPATLGFPAPLPAWGRCGSGRQTAAHVEIDPTPNDHGGTLPTAVGGSRQWCYVGVQRAAPPLSF